MRRSVLGKSRSFLSEHSPKVQRLNSAKMLRDNKVLLKEIETLKKEMMEMKKFKVKLPVIKNEERRMS